MSSNQPQDAIPLTLERRLWRAAILAPIVTGFLALVAFLIAIWANIDAHQWRDTGGLLTILTIPLGGFSCYAALDRNEWEAR